MPALAVAVLMLSPALIEAAEAEGPHRCAIDQVAGQVKWQAGAKRELRITAGGHAFTVSLPTCIEYGDHLQGPDHDPGIFVQVNTATESFDRVPLNEDSDWSVPQPSTPPVKGPWTQFLSVVWQGLTGPTTRISFYAAARAASACPPAHGAPPPLAPVGRLSETNQRIGADLRAIVAMWQPSPEPRLVRAKLLRSDGSVMVQGATCRDSNVVLPLRSTDLHAGDSLVLQLTDTQGGSLRYTLAVVAPDSLPQPPVKPPQDWLVAMWRLAAMGADTRLDAIARVAKASETSFGAQRVLGAVEADAPF
jgi:hypothetical protein